MKDATTTCNTPMGSPIVNNQPQVQSKSFGNESKGFGPNNDKGLNLSAMTAGTVEKTPRKCPAWSLPPPEDKVKKQNSVEDAAKSYNDHDSTDMDVATESGFFSNEGASLENNRMPLNIQSYQSKENNSNLSLVRPEVENESQYENGQSEDAAAPKLGDGEQNMYTSLEQRNSAANQQSDEITLSRPTTPEAPRSSHNPPVTGRHRSCQNNAVGGTNALQNDERELNNPSERDDDTENNGLLTELQKANESLQLNVCFLVEELRKKDSLCAYLRAQCHQLLQRLEEFRGQCAGLQATNEELRRCLDESTVLEAESQRLIRMTQEMSLWKEQECDRLKEHIRQMDQRYDSANCRMENLSRENKEISEELQVAFGQVQDFLQEHEQNLQRERERLRLDSETQLEERMAEVALAFQNAETDKGKRLKQELEREKSNGKTLAKENRRLQALVRQLRSKEEGRVPPGDSCKDVPCSTASSEEEGDEHPGSSNYNQQTDSDDSSDDELFEDARDEFAVSSSG